MYVKAVSSAPVYKITLSLSFIHELELVTQDGNVFCDGLTNPIAERLTMVQLFTNVCTY